MHLIDWDTVRIAPPERDLWSFAQDVTADQVEMSQQAIPLYRMRWDLSEIAEYASWFHAPHTDDANTRYAWEDLQKYLPLRAEVFSQK